jgi:hypothetical protein
LRNPGRVPAAGLSLVRAGRLDSLISSARKEISAGKIKPL